MSESKSLKKILVVDDEVGICEMITEHFSVRGYEVLSAHTVEDGWKIALKEIPDIIILDYNLPDHLGKELLIRVKKNVPEIKVIMVTANDASQEELLSLGADLFFVKGESILTISNKVKELTT